MHTPVRQLRSEHLMPRVDSQPEFTQRTDEGSQNGARELLPADDPLQNPELSQAPKKPRRRLKKGPKRGSDAAPTMAEWHSATARREKQIAEFDWNTEPPPLVFHRHLDSRELRVAQLAFVMGAGVKNAEALLKAYYPTVATAAEMDTGDQHAWLVPMRGFILDQPRERQLKRLEAMALQLRLERDLLAAARAEYEALVDETYMEGRGGQVRGAQLLMRTWFDPVCEAIDQEQKAILAGERRVDRMVYGPYFTLLGPRIMTVLVLHGLMNNLLHRSFETDDRVSGSVKFTQVAMSLGNALRQQVQLEQLKEKIRKDSQARRKVSKLWKMGVEEREGRERMLGVEAARYTEEEQAEWRARFEKLGALLPDDVDLWFTTDDEFEKNKKKTSERWTLICSPKGVRKDETKRRVLHANAIISLGDATQWDPSTHIKIGSRLLDIVTKTAMINYPPEAKDADGNLIMVPAFRHAIEIKKIKDMTRRVGYVHCHDEVLTRMEDSKEMATTQQTKFMPMLVPPNDWTGYTSNVHLTFGTTVMRAREQKENQMLMDAAQRIYRAGLGSGCQKVYDALNVLGAVPWQINVPVLTAVEAIWNKGGKYAKLPDRLRAAPIPDLWIPSFYQTVRTKNGLEFKYARASPLEVRRARFQHAALQRIRNEAYSQRCDLEYKTRVAGNFKECDEIYFPHSMDFRGRAYPLHPHLNHLGSDVCRGILQFAKAKALGPGGLNWLYIQVANLYGGGVDKLPLDERAQFAKDNTDNIFATADAPLDPANHWWADADSPWQLLATCKDIAAALRSGDPETYESKIPIHQDGSCNGLQHYAALGRDEWGGIAVNLTNKDRPQDVYTEVARRVIQSASEDILKGPGRTTKSQAHHDVAIRVSEAIDRKLVKQTVMTSVYGVTFVGARQQVAARLKEKGWTDRDLIFRAGCFAARRTLDGLTDMFSSARSIMQWLADCAALIGKENEPVQWVTPLGLPVVQPYRNLRKQSVRTPMQRVILHRYTDGLPVQRQRQKSAFPPNFIHSIDSSHMMMTAIECAKEGMHFAGVHDSFWTHAADVPRMNEILREQFVVLHSRPILEDLAARFKEDFPNVEFPPLPERGTLDLSDVKNSTYFFS